MGHSLGPGALPSPIQTETSPGDTGCMCVGGWRIGGGQGKQEETEERKGVYSL